MTLFLRWLGWGGCAAVVLGILLAGQSARLSLAQKNLSATIVARDAALSANTTSVVAIAKLRKANKDFARRAGVDPAVAAGAIRALQAHRDKLAGELRQARTERQRVYESHPDCDAFRRITVCPSLTGGLRAPATDRSDPNR